MVFIGGHAEPANMEAIIQEGENVKKKYPDFKYFFSEWFTKGLPLTYHVLREEHPKCDIHAGQIESSQIMYICPEWVDEEAMRTLKVNNEAEFFGESLQPESTTLSISARPTPISAIPPRPQPRQAESCSTWSAILLLKRLRNIFCNKEILKLQFSLARHLISAYFGGNL